MKTISRSLPIHRSGDNEQLSLRLVQLEKMGLEVSRPTYYQIKIGPYNYYWTTGKITVDGQGKPIVSGFDEFLKMVAKPPGQLNFV